ncbi:MAG: MoxR-like ATPase [Candidatus Diapherotrites archaeon]|nr:MoxR-like ATPase [Candidatus Diapherotrites archaeon]MDN5366965.1 MoxR-like ATPase [Candidatus Diapherotrites archaeon]
MVDGNAIERLRETYAKYITGKTDVLEKMLIAILIKGHVLLEGVPGIAKTRIARVFAAALGLKFRRVQFVPDLLPADITGTFIYRQDTGKFELVRGPVFTNVLLADEINRAPPKTQAALLEAMQERQVTIEGQTFPLEEPFFVIATQNPIEQEGTYPLPEAQLDRFSFRILMDLPTPEEEIQILQLAETGNIDALPEPVITKGDLLQMREAVNRVYASPAIKEYIRDLVVATRTHPKIMYGASPRASITLLRGAKARAYLEGRTHVLPDDVKYIFMDATNHRVILKPEVELAGVKVQDVLEEILKSVKIPEPGR